MAVLCRIVAVIALALVALQAAVADARVVAAHTSPDVDRGRLVDFPSPPTRLIAPPRITVWLPPGYDRTRRRHGVLYMHDGQNLFDPALSGYGKVWHADRAIMRLAASGKIAPVIIVGIWNAGPDRARHYLPAAAVSALPGAAQAELRGTLGIKGAMMSDSYARYLVRQLKPAIDRQFRTLPDRQHSFIAGSSMGGLISLHIIARYPKTFAGAACLSIHWPMFVPADHVAPPPHRDAVINAWRGYLATIVRGPMNRRLWLDRGDRTLDAIYPPYQIAADAQLRALGWRDGRDIVSRVYPGTAHTEEAWADRLDEALAWLLAPQR